MARSVLGDEAICNSLICSSKDSFAPLAMTVLSTFQQSRYLNVTIAAWNRLEVLPHGCGPMGAAIELQRDDSIDFPWREILVSSTKCQIKGREGLACEGE
jgi:hypothetical protein